jgi:2-hydroxychromene-2-carboxylate isomerase
MPDTVIEYFYSAHSAYAYLGSARFSEIAAAAGRTIEHRPMDLERVVTATGPGTHNRRTPERAAFFSGRQIERWAEYRSAPVADGFPTRHWEDMSLANGTLVAAIDRDGDIDRLAHRMLESHWRDNADLTDPEILAGLAAEAGFDPASLLEAARSPAAQAAYQTNTADAIERSVFGSPTYFVDGDMFYGQDHLDLVARALEKPFAGIWPPNA